MFIVHKNGNKTSIQDILKAKSTSFTLNNNFCEINIKNLPTRGEGIFLISSCKCNHHDLLGYPSILLGHPSYIHIHMPSIGT